MSAHHKPQQPDWPEPFLHDVARLPEIRQISPEAPDPQIAGDTPWHLTDEEFRLLVEGMWDAFWEAIRKGDVEALAWTEQDDPHSPFIQWCNHGNGVTCVDPDQIRSLAQRVFRENEEKRLVILSNIIAFDTTRARKTTRS